jgi:hypothetical protein
MVSGVRRYDCAFLPAKYSGAAYDDTLNPLPYCCFFKIGEPPIAKTCWQQLGIFHFQLCGQP